MEFSPTPTPSNCIRPAFDTGCSRTKFGAATEFLDAVLNDDRALCRLVARISARRIPGFRGRVNAHRPGRQRAARLAADPDQTQHAAAGRCIPQTSPALRLVCDILVLAFQTDTTDCTQTEQRSFVVATPESEVGIMIHHLLSHSTRPTGSRSTSSLSSRSPILRINFPTFASERTALRIP